MPDVTYKGEKYRVQWPKEIKRLLHKIALKYRQGNNICWTDALYAGALDILPISLQKPLLLSKYYSTLIRKPKHPAPPPRTKAQKEHAKKRMKLYLEAPDKIRSKYSFPRKTVWSPKQKKILLALVKKYRKTRKCIDWQSLIRDPKIKLLPKRSLTRHRSYYWQLVRLLDPKEQEKHRQQARDHIAQCSRSKDFTHSKRLKKFRTKVKNTNNDFLWSLIP